MAEVIINEENFESEVIKSDIPVLVDFYADWCGPCKMLSPIVGEVAEELEGKVKVCKLNVDKVPDVAAKYSVASIPTLIYFKDGEVVNKSVGFLPKDQLLDFVK